MNFNQLTELLTPFASYLALSLAIRNRQYDPSPLFQEGALRQMLRLQLQRDGWIQA